MVKPPPVLIIPGVAGDAGGGGPKAPVPGFHGLLDGDVYDKVSIDARRDDGKWLPAKVVRSGMI